MDLKHSLFTLLTSAALIAPAAAFADHDDDREWWVDHQHTSSCHHTPMPSPPPGVQPGRYEIRTLQQWVEGRWVRDWVPQSCEYKHHGRVKCRAGYSMDRWLPGHYDQVEKWVWVPYSPRPGWQVSVRY